MRKTSLIAAAACIALFAGCSIFQEDEKGLSRYAGKWVFSYEQNGKALQLPVSTQPMVELEVSGRSKVYFRKDGEIVKEVGNWRVSNGELILLNDDGKLSSRFRIVSDDEARSEIPPTEHIKQNTVMVLKKKSFF